MFYEGVVRAINLGFQTQFTFIPTFQDLRSNTSFEDLFLGNLFGINLKKAKSSFVILGQLIRDRLRQDTCISDSTAPKAAVVISSYPQSTGWELLELLFRKRLVSCGAPPDHDLNVSLAMLSLDEGETLQAFYLRTHKLQDTNGASSPFSSIIINY